jgi:hypothetical protein
VVRLKLIEEQEGKLLSSLDPTRAARDARTGNNARTAPVAGTGTGAGAVEKKAADAVTVPVSMVVEGTSAAVVAVDGGAVGADEKVKAAETAAAGAVSAEEGAPAGVMDVDGEVSMVAGEGEKQSVGDSGADGVPAAAIGGEVQGQGVGQEQGSGLESESASKRGTDADGAKEGSKEGKREMTDEQVKMDERDAREWRRCFISACRWFDIDQVLRAFNG